MSGTTREVAPRIVGTSEEVPLGTIPEPKSPPASGGAVVPVVEGGLGGTEQGVPQFLTEREKLVLVVGPDGDGLVGGPEVVGVLGLATLGSRIRHGNDVTGLPCRHWEGPP
jgi:hypothetical protein